jgi:2-polyprenyl-3-methyl-5-hydroxy-6-metoxy-1,4-benzoquinol methylase
VLEDPQRQWERWGKIDPYFAVVTKEQFHAEQLAESRPQFFEGGEREIARMLDATRRFYGAAPFDRALDFGCGVGRLVVAMASRFREVVGVDISDSMLAEARRNCGHLSNVELEKSDAALSAVHGDFDLVHSYIVLQHIPVDRGLAITDRTLKMVRPGGVAVHHYSIQRRLSPIKTAAYMIKHKVPFGRQAINVLQGRPWNLPSMQMNHYALNAVLDTFARNGFEDVFLLPEVHTTAMTVRVFGRKADIPTCQMDSDLADEHPALELPADSM